LENPSKIIIYGDSIAKGTAPVFEKRLREQYPDYTIDITNAGISGETSRDGLKRVESLLEIKPNVVVIGFGMNDWRKGVPEKEYKRNISKMVDKLQSDDTRVILTTITPAREGTHYGSNPQIDKYNLILKDIAITKRLKIADADSLWKSDIKPIRRGLRDNIHPNRLGYEVICKALMHVVPRKNTVVLWQYNGREAKCNYRCPYCYYIGLHHPRDMFFGNINEWHQAFKRAFGYQNLIFYLAFGEPTIGKAFRDIVEMIGSEPKWQLRITSNVSQDLRWLLRSRVALEHRLHINASFHPLAVDRNFFLKQILFLRSHGIEVPVIYVMYPPLLDRFDVDIEFFSQRQFVVHIRRFQGVYGGRKYPWAYTDEQKRRIARFCDDGMIRYMLNQQHNRGDMSYSGLHFFIVDNVGNVGYDSNVFRPYTKYRSIFGNILQDNFRPLLAPGLYPGSNAGTVDGVANLIDAGYRELEGNNVLSFARQGGVYLDRKKVVYKHLDTDFCDSKVRAKYNFTPRNFEDAFHLYRRTLRHKISKCNNLIKKSISIFYQTK
jgi:acyl-CoA thioesterase-1